MREWDRDSWMNSGLLRMARKVLRLIVHSLFDELLDPSLRWDDIRFWLTNEAVG